MQREWYAALTFAHFIGGAWENIYVGYSTPDLRLFLLLQMHLGCDTMKCHYIHKRFDPKTLYDDVQCFFLIA